jgi:hypothetical protein
MIPKLLDEETVDLLVAKGQLDAFVICLAIGTLQAIRSKTIPAEAGIWTLGPPRFWKPLAEHALISQGVLEVLQTCDELSAVEILRPDQFEDVVTELLNKLTTELKKVDDPVWQVEWAMVED